MTEKTLGILEQVDIKEYWNDEARDFTPWLAKGDNLHQLSEALGADLELEGIEVPVGPYRADIVAQDLNSDCRVIVENQLYVTNHDHLGKVITYASGLDAKIVVWIAREFTEEHRRAIDFLNDSTAPNLQFFAIEIQLWRIGNSPAAPKFNVVASPNDYTSMVRDTERELSEARSLYLEFWGGFKEFAKEKGISLSLRKPRPQHWFSFAVGRSKFMIALTASIQKKRVGCEIYMRGKNAKAAFKLLQKERTAIEETTGKLDWQELPDKLDCRIFLGHPGVDITDKEQWGRAFAWLKEKAEIFYRAFSPRIKALPVLDQDETEEDES